MEIIIKDFVALFQEYRFQNPVNLTINHGEQWAFIGPNGSGKTLLTDVIQKRIARKEGSIEISTDGYHKRSGGISSIAFRDIYTVVDCTNAYYQQRWNMTDLGEAPYAYEILQNAAPENMEKYIDLFGVRESLGKKIISLSSGELRKLLIIRSIITDPGLLIIDNPFIGLDEDSRASLNDMMEEMVRSGFQFILAVADPGDIPDWINYVLSVKDKHVLSGMSREKFLNDQSIRTILFGEANPEIRKLPVGVNQIPDYRFVLKMEGVSVRYGTFTILDSIDWEVKTGEKWALLGENGCGKSTLLSLVYGDNPQAYANKIWLFDRRRGTGESIWDIKSRIGYLNSDLHSYYLKDIPAIDVVVSGFFDSIGLFKNGTEEQYRLAREWMEVFGVSNLSQSSFVRLSFGEQRIILLMRAFVKNPDVLILDEPFHGLDINKKKIAGKVIDEFCRIPGKTLIFVTHYNNEIPGCVEHIKKLSKPQR